MGISYHISFQTTWVCIYFPPKRNPNTDRFILNILFPSISYGSDFIVMKISRIYIYFPCSPTVAWIKEIRQHFHKCLLLSVIICFFENQITNNHIKIRYNNICFFVFLVASGFSMAQSWLLWASHPEALNWAPWPYPQDTSWYSLKVDIPPSHRGITRR